MRQSDVEGYPDYGMTTHALFVPDSIDNRREWLDSLSATLDTDDVLDTSPLIPVLSSVQHLEKAKSLRFNVFPNPASSIITITYSLPQSQYVSLKVYNLYGQEIESIGEGYRNSGYFEIIWNADKIKSGIYLISLNASNI